MGTTLTIRNLDQTVKQKLRLRAASHQRSMEAEAREILRKALEETIPPAPRTPEELRERLRGVRGRWHDRGTTDELMELTRGDT